MSEAETPSGSEDPTSSDTLKPKGLWTRADEVMRNIRDAFRGATPEQIPPSGRTESASSWPENDLTQPILCHDCGSRGFEHTCETGWCCAVCESRDVF